MAEFRTVHTKMWWDGWFSELCLEEKFLFMYLFTNPRASVCGIFELPVRIMAFETGLAEKQVEGLLVKFERAKKAYYRDGYIWVVNMRKYQETQSPQVQTRIKKDIDQIPPGELKDMYLAYHNQPHVYPIDPGGYPIDTPSESAPSPADEEVDPSPSDEMAMVETAMLEKWNQLFPNKPQPRKGTYRRKIETRWKDKHFRDNWILALEKASLSQTCQNESWFDFGYFIRSEETYQNMLNNWMAWKDNERVKPKNGNGVKPVTTLPVDPRRAILERMMSDGNQNPGS